MIKLVCLAFSPLVAAVFCAQQAPEFAPAPSGHTEIADRQFLAALDVREAAIAGRVERADQEFLASLQADEPAPVAVPVERAVAVEPEVRVERAIPIEPEMPVRRAIPVSVAEATLPSARQALQAPAVTQIAPLVRRALPGERRRASIIIHGDAVMVVQTAAQR